MGFRVILCLAVPLAIFGQTVCPPTPRYSPCDIAFELPAGATGDLKAEFRSPHAATALVNAFHDGGTRWIVRYTPVEVGEHAFRVTSTDPTWNGKQGTFTATGADRPGWVRAVNVHHFAHVEGNDLKPHLWMGAVVPNFSKMDLAAWKSMVDTRAAQHFNHLGVTLVAESDATAYQSPEFFRAAEAKIRYANDRGILIDVAFFGPNGLMSKLLPTRPDRRKWFLYALSRLEAFDVTWQGLEEWETYPDGKELLKEISEYLAELDPYKHTRSSRTANTSAPLIDDGWLRYRSYRDPEGQTSAVEHQVFQYPAVNDFGAGAKDSAEFRRRLWTSTSNGQYPATTIPDESSADQMKVWYEFMQGTRHWELEPFFDVDNGRATALDGVEYVVYVEKPGPVTVNVEKQGYDVEWLDPATGERTKVKTKGKAEEVTFTPPNNNHDWVLHISREGKKAGMLKSYKFESREPPLALQDAEGNPEKVPFEIVEPAADELSLSKPVQFSVKLKRDSKALRKMTYQWTGEVTVSGHSYRVIGVGATGTFQIPESIASAYPAALHVKLTGMNGLGKVYVIDRNYVLNR